MILDMYHYKYWKQFAQYKGSTDTYSSFLQRIRDDKKYQRVVDTYITSNQNDYIKHLVLVNSQSF